MTALDSAKNTVHSFYKSVVEYVTPISEKSEFNSKGVLTPEEFVTAGDQLVYKCPTWSWETCEAAKRWPFLPKEKQYLMTRNVPCVRRVSSLEADPDKEEIVEDGEWLSTHTDHASAKLEQDIEDIDLGTGSQNKGKKDGHEEKSEKKDHAEKPKEEKISNTILSGIDEEYLNKETATTEKVEEPPRHEHESEDSFEEIPDIESFDDTSNVVTTQKEKEKEKTEKKEETKKSEDNTEHAEKGGDTNAVKDDKFFFL